ncbi:MAG: elongation factor 4 [Deltaproteobacteria bacterium]|nr:elongation factor 4 [Deltaproteobacteria bacterium]
MDHIRNFSIIAHIDHGKSTLADRLIQLTKTIDVREFQNQVLDTMDLERERGITIKSQAITLSYHAKNGQTYALNLIDTPGHVDFSYEVSRSLASCEGVLLVVDASQGVQAQTLANLYLAMEHDLTVIPVINKIDLPSIDLDMVKEQIDHELGLDPDTALLVSAKEGRGIEELLEAIVERIPPPQGDPTAALQSLIFDARYDAYRGTVIYTRVFNGQVKTGDTIIFWSNKAEYRVEEVGMFRIKLVPKPVLTAGDVGYIVAGVKTVSDTSTGDTITLRDNPCDQPLPGFKEVKPVVFSSIYPVDADDYQDLAVALEKLKLNDASLTFQKDASAALGFGFRCGYLGLLHVEIVQERLEREFNLALIMTAPSVRYRFIMSNGQELYIDNPTAFPDPTKISTTEEPYIRAAMIMPERYLGAVIKVCVDHRGTNSNINYLSENRIELTYELPLAEVIYDFYDKIKSVSQGYASFDYDLLDYRPSDLVKLDILINGERLDALSMLIHRNRAEGRARGICKKLRTEIPRQMFKVAIQGAIGAKVIARETISAFRKDVTAKCYGGDISRKRKLLEKQKEGKKRMKAVGSVMVPQAAFLSVLKVDTD